jgi:hypothetical protein
VGLQITGTAANGIDYSNLASSVVLPVGATVTNIAVWPISDALVEGSETINIRLLPGVGYTLNSLTNATITLNDRPIDQWRKDRFNVAELLAPEISGDLADPDADGLSNLMEYALGTNPRQDEPARRPFARVENGFFLFSHSISSTAIDVTIILEQSTNLVDWGTSSIVLVADEEVNGIRTRTVRLSAPVAGALPAYIRMKAQRLGP